MLLGRVPASLIYYFCMKTLTYSIQINKPQDFVYKKIMDKSVYADWAKAWGPDVTYQGEWKIGGTISFFDKTQGGTKIVIEDMKDGEYIKAKHIAMVNPEAVEVELTDDMMKKWIGSLEEYYFKKDSEQQTTLEIVLQVDEAFQEMFDGTWPKALEYFKEICED